MFYSKSPQSLATNITLVLGAGLVVVLVAIAASIDYEVSNQIRTIIDKKIGNLMEIEANNASLPLWSFDKDQLQAIVNNMVADDTIAEASIIDDSGSILTHAAGLFLANHMLGKTIERPITFINAGKPLNIGSLQVTLDYTIIMRQVRTFTAAVIIAAAIILALLVLAIYHVTRHAIAPITRLSAMMTRADKALTGDMPELTSHIIEVRQLVAASQAMQKIYLDYQKDLVAAKEIAEKANEAKSAFLANMSHELRTPLNGILGMLRLLLESKLAEDQYSLADSAFQSSTNLLVIVNDILDLSKIEADEMQLERIGFDPKYVFKSVIDALEHIAREKRLYIIKGYEKEKLPYLLGDPTRFARILTNLIGNAIKYTDIGQVEVYASCAHRDERHVEIHCEVIDTGIGIPKDKLETVFDKFVQADVSTTRRYGGTGLGLAITKELVELMNGKMGVKSEVGRGSTFWFVIPFETTDRLHEEKQVRHRKTMLGTVPPEKARILIAEDHPMNQLLIKKLMKKFGIGLYKVVENGIEALKAYQESPWDVILMDCHMPEKNGYDATKDIRDLEKGKNLRTPIVAMTANTMVGDREKCLRYGMDEYMGKPINVDDLKEILGQWICFDNQSSSDPSGGIAQADQEILDISQLRTFSENDREMEKELVKVFIEQSNKNLDILKKTASLERENKQWVEAAHMFKGGAAGIGAAALALLCDQAQHFIGTSQARAELLEKIKAEYDLVKVELVKLDLMPPAMS